MKMLRYQRQNVLYYFQDEDTPLHNACRQGSSSLVNLLLDNRGDPNLTNKVRNVVLWLFHCCTSMQIKWILQGYLTINKTEASP